MIWQVLEKMKILGNMDLEKIVLPFYKLILAYCQLIIVPQQQARVAKCHIFYTEQIFQIKFYPMKSA